MIKIIKIIFKYTSINRYYLIVMLSVIASILETIMAATLLPIIFIFSGIDQSGFLKVFENLGLNYSLNYLISYLLLALLLRFAFRYTVEYFKYSFIENVRKALILTLTKDYINLKMDLLVKYTAGKMNSLITHDVERVTQLIQSFLQLSIALFSAIILFLVSLYLNIIFTLIFIATSLSLFSLYKLVMNVSYKLSKAISDSSSGYQQVFADYINNYYYWKISGKSNYQFGKLDKELNIYFNGRIRIGKLNALIISTKDIIIVLSLFISLYINSYVAVHNSVTEVLVIIILFRSLTYVSEFVMNNNVFASSSMSLVIIDETLEDFKKNNFKPHSKIKDWDSCKINSEYTYQNTDFKLVLSDLLLEKGVLYGVEGVSGIGKSTLLKLLSGSMAPISVFTNSKWNIDVNFKVGYLSQNPVIINGTVLENLVLDDCKPNHERINFLIEKVGLSQRFNSKKGLLENLNSLNLNLSGGQLQRLALARELYRDVDLLLLDEPTSGLDEKTEIDILDLIIKSSKEMCVVMVSHNPNALNKCNAQIKLLKNDKGVTICSI